MSTYEQAKTNRLWIQILTKSTAIERKSKARDLSLTLKSMNRYSFLALDGNVTGKDAYDYVAPDESPCFEVWKSDRQCRSSHRSDRISKGQAFLSRRIPGRY